MGSFILQFGCTILCPHGGVTNVVTTNSRVRVSGSFALLATDTYTITGCPFTTPAGSHPCVTIQWQNEAKRVKVSGNPVLLQTSIGLCKAADGVVQGTALITGVQTRVRGM
ncbi:MAG TPA: hypothetical protein G4O11_13010 [Anaerolineae bacterium]|nr:hypothetical protein [Anaerolineae bacterium]